MPKPSVPVPGAQQLADLIQQAARAKGWMPGDLARESYDVMKDDPSAADRQRIGLARRSWEKIWRGQVDARMDEYSYLVMDRTLGLPAGASRAAHHGEELPEVEPSALEELRAEVEELRDEVAGLVSLVARALGKGSRE